MTILDGLALGLAILLFLYPLAALLRAERS